MTWWPWYAWKQKSVESVWHLWPLRIAHIGELHSWESQSLPAQKTQLSHKQLLTKRKETSQLCFEKEKELCSSVFPQGTPHKTDVGPEKMTLEYKPTVLQLHFVRLAYLSFLVWLFEATPPILFDFSCCHVLSLYFQCRISEQQASMVAIRNLAEMIQLE